MLDESFLNLQITILLSLGTIIFIFTSFKRRELIIYLPAYLFAPIGYLFVYLQILDNAFRLLGNLFFLIGVLALIIAIYYEYFKTIKKIHKVKETKLKNNKILLSFSPFISVIIGIQIIFSILILIAILMLIKLFLMERSTKNASLSVFLTSALLTAVSTILSYFELPGMWEFSFVGTIIFSAVYFIFPILLLLEERLIKSKIQVKETEEKSRLISENANDLIAILNDKYEYEYVNEQAYLRFLGYSKDQLIGKRVWELVHPDDIERLVNSQQLTIDGFQEVEGEDKAELRIKHKNGIYIWMEYTAKVFVNSQGNPNVIIITRDITERKKAEEVLKESEEKFRTIAEESMVGISIIQDNLIKYINQKFLDYLGYKLEEVQKWQPSELFDKVIHPDQREEITEYSRQNQLGENTSTFNFEVKMILKNGEIRWLDIYSRSIIYEGRPAGMNISIDITDKINTEQELKESEEKYRSLFENSPISLMDQDFSEIKRYIDHLKESGINDFKKYFDNKPEEAIKCMSKAKLVDVNRKALEVYKVSNKEDFVNKMNQFSEGKFDEMTEDAFLDNKKEILSLINGNTIYESEIITETFAGDLIALYAKTSIVPGFESTWSKVIVSIIDITERKKAEEIVREENIKLLELDNLRKELITRISHELRTPLTSMYAASQILLRSNQEDSIGKILPYIEISHRGAIRLKELIDNLLDSSRIENKKFELKYSNENITTIINDCVKELSYLAKDRQITLNNNVTTDIYVKLDKYRFPQVLINILSNAIKNTPPNGMVFLTVNETEEYFDILIKDTGVGLTQEEKGRLFQKFGKIERFGMDLDVDIEGAGLGLYISKEIVELHGGEIIVESEGRNKGSTFIIRLNKEV